MPLTWPVFHPLWETALGQPLPLLPAVAAAEVPPVVGVAEAGVAEAGVAAGDQLEEPQQLPPLQPPPELIIFAFLLKIYLMDRYSRITEETWSIKPGTSS